MQRLRYLSRGDLVDGLFQGFLSKRNKVRICFSERSVHRKADEWRCIRKEVGKFIVSHGVGVGVCRLLGFCACRKRIWAELSVADVAVIDRFSRWEGEREKNTKSRDRHRRAGNRPVPHVLSLRIPPSQRNRRSRDKRIASAPQQYSSPWQ
ncbi:hypothetical protein GHT06_020933 [Daphnia sinensis]|uniref:Uncharacterized protein n=1 Tax=Daphnia sinensis TaxID=1820382 RepID=A0AAD5KZR8_9CRUS|nr:hypothetical protein GHT06_020933 [Daphnia sinensis]